MNPDHKDQKGNRDRKAIRENVENKDHNNIFASFSSQEIIIPENAILPLELEIPDITKTISPYGQFSIMLNPSYYAVYYYISTAMKKRRFIKVTPVLNDCGQTAYAGYAEAVKRKETLSISRYFMIEAVGDSTLSFLWCSSEIEAKVSLNINIEKLCRQ